MDYQELLETLGWLNRLFVGQKMLDHISSAPKGQIVTEENKEEEPRIDLEAKEVNLDMLQLLKNKFGK